MTGPFRRQSVTVVAGECEPHTWCGNCQAATRVRLALHDGSPSGPPLAVIEVCPGCGANHATPNVSVTPEPPSLLGRLRRTPRDESAVCAFGDCRKTGKREHAHEVVGDEGTWTYVFCSGKHKRAWADAHWIPLPRAGR